jgi:very-short-patch-repair endonuclease
MADAPDSKRTTWRHGAQYAGAQRALPSPASPPARARRLRRTSGDAERKFWSRTRNRRLGGFKFKRQVPLGPYIADFVCPEARLIVEIDGDQHAEAVAYDRARTRYLELCGYAVIRIPTHEVLHDLEYIVERVHRALEERMMELKHR